MNTARRDRLVDRRFERPLNAREREELETHLVSSPVALERYRKLHLIERVVALGPERALEEPSPAEIERIAVDLGLADEPRSSHFAWRRWLPIGGFSVTFMTAVAALWVLAPRQEIVNERGSEAPAISVAPYIVSPDGEIRPADVRDASTTEFLKLRITQSDDAPDIRHVAVRFVTSAGIRDVPLEAPKFDAQTVSIPGAVALDGLEPGATKVFVVFSARPITIPKTARDQTSIQRALGADVAVQMLELTIGGPAP